MGLVESDIHNDPFIKSGLNNEEQFRKHDSLPYSFQANDPSLHNTRAINLSNLNGSKLAADILRRREGSLRRLQAPVRH